SEEHTSELQSHLNLVCRLLLDKKMCVLVRFFLWAIRGESVADVDRNVRVSRQSHVCVCVLGVCMCVCRCVCLCVFFKEYGDHRDLHSFPTRRSSDLSHTHTHSHKHHTHTHHTLTQTPHTHTHTHTHTQTPPTKKQKHTPTITRQAPH